MGNTTTCEGPAREPRSRLPTRIYRHLVSALGKKRRDRQGARPSRSYSPRPGPLGASRPRSRQALATSSSQLLSGSQQPHPEACTSQGSQAEGRSEDASHSGTDQRQIPRRFLSHGNLRRISASASASASGSDSDSDFEVTEPRVLRPRASCLNTVLLHSQQPCANAAQASNQQSPSVGSSSIEGEGADDTDADDTSADDPDNVVSSASHAQSSQVDASQSKSDVTSIDSAESRGSDRNVGSSKASAEVQHTSSPAPPTHDVSEEAGADARPPRRDILAPDVVMLPFIIEDGPHSARNRRRQLRGELVCQEELADGRGNSTAGAASSSLQPVSAHYQGQRTIETTQAGGENGNEQGSDSQIQHVERILAELQNQSDDESETSRASWQDD